MTSLVIETPTGPAISRQAGLVLRPIRGESDTPIPLAIGRYVLGSAADADVRLDVQGIDARHAVLFVGPQRSVLKAFSRFTWVNDGVVRESSIKPGDRICLGPVEFEVLKGRTQRVRQRKPTKSSGRSTGVAQTPARPSLDTLTLLPAQALVSGEAHQASLRRRQVIAELNGELLSQLSQIVERETVASDRERRILEQSAQLEGRRKILDDRHADFERLRAELSRSEADWRSRSIELSEQAAQLKLEREALERERSKCAEETGRLNSQTHAVEQRREALDVREARLEEQQAALELRATQLNLQEHSHSAAVAQALLSSQNHAADVQRFSAEQAACQQQSEQLRMDREQFDRERAQYESDRDKLFAERAHLAAREVEIAELRRQLHEQQAELANRDDKSQELLREAEARAALHGETASQLAQQEQSLADQAAAIAVERNELDRRKCEIDEQHAAWMLERRTLAAKASSEEREAEQAASAEIAELRRHLDELQAELEIRDSKTQELLSAATSSSALNESASQLAQREHALSAQEAAQLIERNALDERKREIDEQHAAWMLERHTLAARASSEEREAEQAAGAEINMLRSQISELQTRLREERRDWEQERLELMTAAEPAPAVPVEAAFSGDQADLQAEITTLRNEFETERARFEQERTAWEAEQDLLLRDRMALEAEWRRLEARTDNSHQPDIVAHEAGDIHEITPPSIPSQVLDQDEHPACHADPNSWEHPVQTDEYQPGFTAAQNGHETAWSQPVSEDSTFEQYSEYPAEDGYEQPSGFASPGTMEEEQSPYQEEYEAQSAAAGGGDVLSLRAQLAELFGIQSRPEDEAAGEHPTYEGFDDPSAEPGTSDEFQQNQASYEEFEQPPVAADPHQQFETLAEQPTNGFDETEADGGQSDEEIMSAYLARLLNKSPEAQEPVTKTVAAAPEPSISNAIETTDEAQEEEPQKPTRRLNAEEKETLRANMDSFRELANQQARAAVAKHKSNELKNGVQTVSVVAALIAVVGAILISAEFWTNQSYRIYGLACLAISGGLGVYTLVNGMRIRRLKAVAQMTEALGGDEPDPAAERTE